MKKAIALFAAMVSVLAVAATASATNGEGAGKVVFPSTASYCVDSSTVTLTAPVRDNFPEGRYGNIEYALATLAYDSEINLANYEASKGSYTDPPTFQWVDGHLVITPGATHTIYAGPCVSAQVDRVGACASGDAYRVADGSTGEYVDVTVAQLASGSYTDTNGNTFNLTPENFVQGVGGTCNVPAGYTFSGYDVSQDGTVDTAAPQFNDEPYFVSASS